MMDCSLNPHHLVALMQKTIPSHQNVHSSHMIGDIFNNTSSEKLFTFQLLDALAGICISKRKHEAIALALQLGLQESKIRLIIAQNGDVENSLVKYLTRVWKMLQKLSEEFAHRRAIRMEDSEKSTPKCVDDGPPSITLDIFREISIHTMQHFSKRMEKWLGGLSALLGRLCKVRKSQLKGIERSLKIAFLASQHAYKILSQECLTSDEWQMAYDAMGLTTQEVDLLIRDSMACEILAYQFKGMLLPHVTF